MRVCLRQTNGQPTVRPEACEAARNVLWSVNEFLHGLEEMLTKAEREGTGIKEVSGKFWDQILTSLVIHTRRIGLLAEGKAVADHIEDAWKAHIADLDDETHKHVLQALAENRKLKEAYQRVCGQEIPWIPDR